jgi:hypothetical protein
LIVEHEVTEEYQQQNELWHRDRILWIRLFKGAEDEYLPITSYANRKDIRAVEIQFFLFYLNSRQK